MSLFKSKKPALIEKTITLIDAESNEIEEIFDIVSDDEPVIEAIEIEDVSIEGDKTLKEVQELYPDEKDIKKFILDSCKVATEIAKKDINDTADITAEKKLIEDLTDPKVLEDLNDKENEKNTANELRQEAIVEAEKKKHELASK